MRISVEIESIQYETGLSLITIWNRLDHKMTSESLELASSPFLYSQTSGGKHLIKGARLERHRQTSQSTGSSRDLEHLANATADAVDLSDTRIAAIEITISLRPQQLWAMMMVWWESLGPA